MAIRFVLKQRLPSVPEADYPAIAERFFEGDLFTFGSDGANNLVVPEAAPEQAVIVREGGQLTLINGAEGTRLNDDHLRREAMQPLAPADRIEIGSYVILVLDDAAQRADNPRNAANETSIRGEAEPNPGANAEEAGATRNFADVLDALRTEEDSFYFIVENGARQEAGRLPLEQPELPVGVDQKGEIVSAAERLSSLYALVRKDWSGILLESRKRGAVFVNGELLETTRRLRNNDRVTFSAPVKSSLVLHEPSSLVALESLLSARAEAGGALFANPHQTDAASVNSQNITAERKTPLLERRFFGYFNFTEVITMFIATLIGAVLIFLFLEFAFS